MTFKPGHSGNPGGRKKMAMADGRSLRDMAREHTEECLNALLKVMRGKETPPAAVAQAASTLLDRGWGKPTQPIAGDDAAPPIAYRDMKDAPEEVVRWVAAQSANDEAIH